MRLNISFLLFFLCNYGFSQLITSNVLTPNDLVASFLEQDGMTVANVQFNHSLILANEVQTQVGYFNASSTSLTILEGVILTTGNCSLAEGPNDNMAATDNTGVAIDPDDPDLMFIEPLFPINNECILEFDFTTTDTMVSFDYVFASEEYHEFVDGGYSDVFAIFASGPGIDGPYTEGAENIAVLASGEEINIDNINSEDNSELLAPPDDSNIQYDAFTVTLTAILTVVPGETYHIKFAIADVGDTGLDSGVFIKAASYSPCVESSIYSTLDTIDCSGSFISPSGNYVYTSSGVYSDTLTSSSGCDSIITIHLNTNPEIEPVHIFPIACGSYLVPSGDESYTENGVYNDTIVSSIECDSILIIHLTVTDFDNTVLLNTETNTLSSAQDGATYQWLDCENEYLPIDGAISQSYTPETNGSYALLLTVEDCEEISECWDVLVNDPASIGEQVEADIYVYPNPVKDKVVIGSNSLNILSVHILNTNGQLVYNLSGINKNEISLNPDLNAGLYIIQLYHENGRVNKKLIIE